MAQQTSESAQLKTLEKKVDSLEQVLLENKNTITEKIVEQKDELISHKNEFLEFKKSVFTQTNFWIWIGVLLALLGISIGSAYNKLMNYFKKELESLFHTRKSVILALIEDKELLLKYYKEKKILVVSKKETSEQEIKRLVTLNPDLAKFKKVEFKKEDELSKDVITRSDLIILNNANNDLDSCEKLIKENKGKQFIYYNITNSRINPADNSNWCAANFPATLFESIVKQLKFT